MKHEVYCHDGYFEVKTFGDANPEGFRKYRDDLLAHEKWTPGTALLLDHSELNSGPLTVDDIHKIASESVEARLGHVRTAVVVGRNLEFGLTRMWEVFVDGKWDVDVRVFRSRDEGISWLKDTQ